MKINAEHILLIGSILLLISIFAGKTSYKFGVPTLILFLGIGMLAGSDGIGGIYFNSPDLANFIGVVALNIILFSGGLDTRWRSVKPILSEGVMLSTLGVFLTAGTVGVFTWLVSDFSLSEGLLLGSIVSSTDAPAVFSILRSKSINLKENIKPVLELESGSNDPMAYFLTITMTSIVLSGEINTWSAVMGFVLQLVLGLIGGVGFGKINTFIINKIQLDFEGLYPVLGLTLCFITYSVVSFLGGNGFLAIYIAAVIMGNAQLIHKSSLVKFFDGLAWLMQIVLFLTLGLLVFPSQMPPIMEIGLVISVFMILVARPLSVFISLAFFKMSFRGKMFVSWVGLRGAVPIVFAIYPMVAGVAKADVIFTLVFFIALLSVTIQGTTVSTMAKWLGVEEKDKVDEEANARFFDNVKSASTEVVVPSGSTIVGKKIYQIGLPASTLVVMIKRDHKYFVPSGATEIEPKDKLYIIADDATSIHSSKQLLGDT